MAADTSPSIWSAPWLKFANLCLGGFVQPSMWLFLHVACRSVACKGLPFSLGPPKWISVFLVVPLANQSKRGSLKRRQTVS